MSDSHKCAVKTCDAQVPARMLMCRKHWFMLSPKLRADVWREYQPGQETRDGPSPSPEYMRILAEARAYIASKEVDSGL